MEKDKINFFADVNTTRGKIISVACDILKEGNYQVMTTSIISKAAGISEGTIYRYFNSKKEILLTILDELNNYFVKTFFSGVDNNKSLSEKLNIIGENFFIHKDELASLYSIMFRVFSEVSDVDVRERFKQIYDKILNQISFLLLGKDFNEEEAKNSSIFSTYLLWGAGELLWKLDIVNEGKVLNKEIIQNMLNMISKIIEMEKEKK
ncbi:MAG: TetR/AcrR family transcriptional regulator [Exilispira sp.]|jgi:AcrR family transcriptional regulator|nr:TetR/AcrR family transcriptional regulator [Exilispira sp.]